MKDELVTFETAQLAKEKGFDWKCEYFYGWDNTKNSINYPQAYIFDYKTGKNLEYVLQRENWNKFDFDKEKILGSKWSTIGIIVEYFTICCSASTQSLLQKWLREEHNIHVYARNGELDNEDTFFAFYFDMNNIEETISEVWKYDTYEEALEKGLEKSLKLIE